MTNTYDTSNFLPCPFCGAAPEAIDWPGGPMAKVFIHCPNDNYDSEDGGCSVGPDVVGSDIEQAAARWNRRAQVPEGQAIGLLARVQGWWQNTDGDMPASLEQDIAALLTASPASGPDVCTPAMEAAAEKYWKERRFKGLSEDPRTWKGLYRAMCAARKQEEAEPAVQHRYPCGCVTCICEDDVQCQGCGGTSCDDFKGPSCGCTHLKEEAER